MNPSDFRLQMIAEVGLGIGRARHAASRAVVLNSTLEFVEERNLSSLLERVSGHKD